MTGGVDLKGDDFESYDENVFKGSIIGTTSIEQPSFYRFLNFQSRYRCAIWFYDRLSKFVNETSVTNATHQNSNARTNKHSSNGWHSDQKYPKTQQHKHDCLSWWTSMVNVNLHNHINPSFISLSSITQPSHATASCSSNALVGLFFTLD